MANTTLTPAVRPPVSPSRSATAPAPPVVAPAPRPTDTFEFADLGTRREREALLATGIVGPEQPRFRGLLAETKQDVLFHAASVRRYRRMPKDGEGGLADQPVRGIVSMLGGAFRAPFDERADVRPARQKLFHPSGALAKVVFEAEAGSPFTGLFRSGAVGVARLSHSVKNGPQGLGLSLLVDGKESRALQASYDLETLNPGDFFDRSLSNVLPKPRSLAMRVLGAITGLIAGADPLAVEVAQLADVDRHGVAVPKDRIRAPYEVFFLPADAHTDTDPKTDFRDDLAKIPPGTVIYQVYGRETRNGPAILLGKLRTQSAFVTGPFVDRVFHNPHRRRER